MSACGEPRGYGAHRRRNEGGPAVNDLTPGDVIAKLATLGEPRQIADHLLAQGIRGDHRADTCPVARYVHQETKQRVTVAGAAWIDAAAWIDDGTAHSMPRNVARFVQAFDFGFFPELEHEEAS